MIILDDICYEADLDWFDFAPIQSENPGEEFTFALLVATRCRYLLPAADTVEIDMLDEADAIQLLIQESGENLSQTLMAESPEMADLLRRCDDHFSGIGETSIEVHTAIGALLARLEPPPAASADLFGAPDGFDLGGDA